MVLLMVMGYEEIKANIYMQHAEVAAALEATTVHTCNSDALSHPRLYRSVDSCRLVAIYIHA